MAGRSEHAHERIERLDHVAIAVEDMAATVPLFVGALGARFITGGDNHENGLRLVHLQFPGLKLELMQPIGDHSILASSLADRGPGFHHMTFFVDDVPKTVDALEADGFDPVGTDLSVPTWRETFLRPADTFGALIQFVDSTRTWGVPTEEFGFDDVLAGDVVWRDHLACLHRPSD